MRLLRPLCAGCFSLICFLVEDCSPHACKLHMATIRSKGGEKKKLWIRFSPMRTGSFPLMECT